LLEYNQTWNEWADYSADGYIEFSEWMLAMIDIDSFMLVSDGNNFTTLDQAENAGITEDEFNYMDTNGDNFVTLDEFIAGTIQ